MKKILISLAIASTFAVDARASDITFHPDSNAITIDGKMIFGDEKKFLQFALPLEPGAVVIFRNNPGGNLRAGIEIGKIIRMKGFNTFAPNECSSACALAWTAGVNRVMTSSSRVGFHAAYEIKSDGTTLPVGQGNAIIGAYLNSLGFSEAAIRFATYQNANGLEFLTKDMADKLGIIVSIDNNSTPPRPELRLRSDGAKYVTQTFADGSKYVGEFKDGKSNGQGTYTWADGHKYVGEFKDDKINGQGTFTLDDGQKYVGEFKDDMLNGQGTYTSAKGDKYVGEFKDGKRNGQGTFTSAKGDKYVGEFKDDKINGQGTFTLADGNKYVGEWKDGKLRNLK